jgi:hypothetical protein
VICWQHQTASELAAQMRQKLRYTDKSNQMQCIDDEMIPLRCTIYCIQHVSSHAPWHTYQTLFEFTTYLLIALPRYTALVNILQVYVLLKINTLKHLKKLLAQAMSLRGAAGHERPCWAAARAPAVGNTQQQQQQQQR